MTVNGGLFYDGDENLESFESATMYKPGGYYAALLGDILPKRSTSRKPRYRLMQKLGHGAFSTVWLARDLHGNFGYVAVKINISRITGKNNEIDILRWLQKSEKNRANDRNLIYLLDYFLVQGPNGTHECLVTEVVAGMDEFRYSSTFQVRAKEVSYQIMLGLSHLHERGVAHGDLHVRNLAISLPQLKSHSEEAMMDGFGSPTCIPLIARNPAEQSASLPAYLVAPVSLVDYLTETGSPVVVEPLCVKIMDFGNSFREKKNRPPPNTPITIRAPEVTFCELSGGKVGSDWNLSTDIWAAACTLYELNFGHVLLYGMNRGDAIIYSTFQLAGPCPPNWQQYWDLNQYCVEYGETAVIDPDNFWSKRRADRVDSMKKGLGLNSEQDTDQLIDLLRKMLRLVPEERPPIKDLLAHPWFSGLHRKKK